MKTVHVPMDDTLHEQKPDGCSWVQVIAWGIGVANKLKDANSAALWSQCPECGSNLNINGECSNKAKH